MKQKMKHYKQKRYPLWYKDIYNLGDTLISLYTQHKEKYFPRLPTNKTDSRTKICRWIYENCVLKGRGDIYERTLLSLPNPHFYSLKQKSILTKAYSTWGLMTMVDRSNTYV